MKNIRYSRIKKAKFLSALKKVGFILLGLFIILSIIPYLLPLQALPGPPFKPLFENSKLTTTENIKLHYRQWQTDSAEKVFLVHCFAGSTFSWRYTAPALASAGYQVVAVRNSHNLPLFIMFFLTYGCPCFTINCFERFRE